MRKFVSIAAALAVIALLGLIAGGAGACGPLGSAKYRIAPSPVVGRIAVGTGSTLGAGHPFGRGNAEGRKARKGVPLDVIFFQVNRGYGGLLCSRS